MNEQDNDLLSELDLAPEEGALRLRGALKKEFFVEYERDLTEADIKALQLLRGSVPPSLQRIHASHHALAKCLATGMNNTQAGLVTGYSASRISILLNDAAFQTLVAEYRAEARGLVADVTQRMVGMHLDALELLHDRMQAKPEEFSIPMLLDVIKTFADRTGHGPGQEIHMKVDQNFIDRPPRESFEDWERRRGKELKLLN